MTSRLNAGTLNRIRSVHPVLLNVQTPSCVQCTLGSIVGHLPTSLFLSVSLSFFLFPSSVNVGNNIILLLGYQILPWSSEWCLLLGTSSHYWHIANWWTWFCLSGIIFVTNRFSLFSFFIFSILVLTWRCIDNSCLS